MVAFENLPEMTEAEVTAHSDWSSCWTIIDGIVYDLTKFLDEHPGGGQAYLEQPGKNATEPFNDVGHSADAREMAKEYAIGRLKPRETIVCPRKVVLQANVLERRLGKIRSLVNRSHLTWYVPASELAHLDEAKSESQAARDALRFIENGHFWIVRWPGDIPASLRNASAGFTPVALLSLDTVKDSVSLPPHIQCLHVDTLISLLESKIIEDELSEKRRENTMLNTQLGNMHQALFALAAQCNAEVVIAEGERRRADNLQTIVNRMTAEQVSDDLRFRNAIARTREERNEAEDELREAKLELMGLRRQINQNRLAWLTHEQLLQSQVESLKFIDRHLPFGCFDVVAFPSTHTISDEVHKLTESQLDYALKGANDTTMWTLFASDGGMNMYKRELVQDGLPVDPLKALHSVKGVSALEYMHYFFDAAYKMGWDHTLDDARVVERVAADLVVMHQKHNTASPEASHESLFWSHLRRVDDRKSEGAHDCYIVCNKDIKRADVPLASSSAVRVGLTVSMICETFVDNPENLPLSQLKRSAFTCKVIYVSSVHPGGGVDVYKREYPKFLRTFTAFVQEKVKKSPQVAI